jgi:putative transposase
MSKTTDSRYYHLYNRGRSRLSICHAPEDYLDILGKLKQYGRQYRLTPIAYTLLPNHYHILVRQDDAPRPSLLTQRIFNSYSKRYNRKYQHSGTLFEDHVKVKPVADERYLLHLCRYIHANPVLHGLTRSLDEWPYTNYHEWIETRSGTLVDRDFIKAYFPTPDNYHQFVLDYLHDRRNPDGLDYLEEWTDVPGKGQNDPVTVPGTAERLNQ